MFLRNCSAVQKVFTKVGPVLGTLVCFAIVLERERSFAQSSSSAGGDFEVIESSSESASGNSSSGSSQGKTPTKPLGDAFLTKFKNIKTKAEACRRFEGKIVVYYDISSFVQNCKLRLIEDSDVLNEAIKSENLKIEEIPAEVYRLIPFGEPYDRGDIPMLRSSAKKKLSASECSYLNNKYVTASGMTYYWVEKCRKKAFQDFYELQEHNRNKAPIISVSPEFLNRIPLGDEMKSPDGAEAKILYKIDGDVMWSKLLRQKEGQAVQADSPETLAKIEKDSKKPINKNNLCQKINRKIVSFYSQVYFGESCILRPIEDFSLELQRQLAAKGGVSDLTPEEMITLPVGKVISPDVLLKTLK